MIRNIVDGMVEKYQEQAKRFKKKNRYIPHFPISFRLFPSTLTLSLNAPAMHKRINIINNIRAERYQFHINIHKS